MSAYNGWTNYETWNVKLWMDSDGEDSYWADIAKELLRRTRDQDAACAELARQMQSEYHDGMPEILGTYSDLLGAALERVNWREISAAIMEGMEDENND